MAQLSPMMAQYFEIKKKHKDEIVFFRLGDFYEMFYDDAILASKELELTLTGRDCGQEERAPMCGVPFHSYENYVAKLIAKGYKVAICEQMEDPAAAKGLVKRDIIRVITPGTVIESSMLQDDKNNYIGSVYLKNGSIGVCFADVSTGSAHTTELAGEKLSTQLIAELCRYNPSELLFNTALLDFKDVTAYIKQHMTCSVELMEDECYAPDEVERLLTEQFGADWSKATGLSRDGNAHAALSALLGYLHRTQKKGVERLKLVHSYAEAQYMQLSPVTRANLELTETMRGREKRGTLLWVLDKTQTAMGKRLLRSWLEQPLVSSAAINRRLNCVQALYSENIQRAELSEALSHVFDMERLMTRTVYGSATPKEIYALASTCTQLPLIRELAAGCGCPELEDLAQRIDPLEDIRDRIFAALDEETPATLKDGGVIKQGYNAEVDELRDIVHGGKGYLSQLEARMKEETGIRTLKVGYNRVFGYYLEVSKSFTDQVPENFIRKQTLANAERYITEELKQLEGKILGASERLLALERQLFEDLLQDLSAQILRVQNTASALAQLDVFTALAQVAVNNNYVRPVVDDGDELIITEGRHPVIEQMLKGSLFVPNNTLLDCGENNMLIITGPNMAGKSTYMRQNALITLMAQIGSFVPAQECRVGVVDAIFTRVGASDDLAAGQSTFMVEMTEVAEILQYATKRSLVILDEIGRGTSTFDGMSIARAVVEHIAGQIGCKTLFATHYHELTELESAMDCVKNYNIAVKKRGDDITFLRRIVRGPADDSYGIQVAKLAGLPDSVTKRAKEVLRALEASAPKKQQVEQLDFGVVEEMSSPALPSEILDKLRDTDLNTLTGIEGLQFLCEIKNALQ
ncbi:DNA mismatch repair protein MutS [Gemmiger sp. An194]|uniref:DNA mismatch repair protein MutS n=1 Tax=Gemmiger sp. An194 TaxID=1965582 RepID=UPI000B383EBF|nr:DNA mismatch repair protein MutS [Gemmiger sp. An194]OUP25073.1 DNA mismatch repair protein MutS [Gemmiger sp. An194]